MVEMDALTAFHTLLVNRTLFDDEAFLRRLSELSEHGGTALTAEVARLLAVPRLHAHVKYLLLKHAQRHPEALFVPAACRVVEHDPRVRLRSEAMAVLGRVATPAAYRELARYADGAVEEGRGRAAEILAETLSANPLLFHYDVFWRPQRGRKNLSASADFLARQLPEEDLIPLLASISPPLREITGAAWQLFAARGSGPLFPSLLKVFLGWQQNLPEAIFLEAARAVVGAAADSGFRAKACATLTRFASELPEPQRLLLQILLLRLDTPALLPGLAGRYDDLPPGTKTLFLECLDPAASEVTGNFAAHQLAGEDDPDRLARLVRLVLSQGEAGLEILFRRLSREMALRRGIMLEAAIEASPPGIDRFLIPLLSGETDPHILRAALDPLLKSPADDLLPPLEQLLGSGAEAEVKSLIVRRLPRFSLSGQKRLALFLTDRFPMEREVRKDLLISLLEVLNRPGLDEEVFSRLVERVLLMMEDASLDEIVQFVYFFDRLVIPPFANIALIQGELRMMQNTLLQAGDPVGLVGKIHLLLHRLENKHPRARKRGAEKGRSTS